MAPSDEAAPQQSAPEEPVRSVEQSVHDIPLTRDSTWARIKRHKVVEWTLAYTAFGYALLHGVEIVGHAFEWPSTVPRFTIYVLLLGTPSAATLAYYHGHRAQQRVSRIEISILAALLLVAGSVLWFVARSAQERGAESRVASAGTTTAPTQPVFSPPARSVAVLPFADMSEQHDQEYFADGLSEELIDHLSRSPELRVIARTSSFYFKGKQATVREMAAALNVRYLVEGSVRKSGSTLRIATQLISTTDGSYVWSETYDRSLSDIFKVQSDIASQVSRALDTTLVAASAPARGTKDVEAYNLVLEGHFYQTRRNQGDLARAVEAYSRALELDPNYTEAWVRLGSSYLSQGAEDELDRMRAEHLAMECAKRALQIEPESSAAHRLVGGVQESLGWNWDAASTEYERAVSSAADPNERSRSRLSIEYLRAIRTGRYSKEYWNLLEENLIRNPLDTSLMHGLAFDYLNDGQFDRAIDLLRRALRINPTGDNGSVQLAFALMLTSRFGESLETVQGEQDEESRRQLLAMLMWSLGRHAESDRYLSQLEHEQPAARYTIAQIHAWRGEKDLAFEWLARAYEAHAAELSAVRLDPLLTSIRSDKRYTALLRKMNLAE